MSNFAKAVTVASVTIVAVAATVGGLALAVGDTYDHPAFSLVGVAIGFVMGSAAANIYMAWID